MTTRVRVGKRTVDGTWMGSLVHCLSTSISLWNCVFLWEHISCLIDSRLYASLMSCPWRYQAYSYNYSQWGQPLHHRPIHYLISYLNKFGASLGGVFYCGDGRALEVPSAHSLLYSARKHLLRNLIPKSSAFAARFKLNLPSLAHEPKYTIDFTECTNQYYGCMADVRYKKPLRGTPIWDDMRSGLPFNISTFSEESITLRNLTSADSQNVIYSRGHVCAINSVSLVSFLCRLHKECFLYREW